MSGGSKTKELVPWSLADCARVESAGAAAATSLGSRLSGSRADRARVRARLIVSHASRGIREGIKRTSDPTLDCAPEPLDKQLEEEVRQLEQKSDGLARVLKEKRQSVPAALQAALSSAAKQSLERIVQDDGEPSSSSSSSEIAGLGRATAAVARASQATAGAKARLQDAGKIVAASQQGAKEASAALDRAAGMPATEAEKALAGKRGPSAMTPAAAKRRRVR